MTPEEIVERAAEVLRAYWADPDHVDVGFGALAQALADAALLPTEVEWGAEGETPEPWAAALDERTRDEAERYVARFGGHVVQRLVTPWTEVTS